MTVGELRRLLEGIPDETPVVITDRDSPGSFAGTSSCAALVSLFRTTAGEYFDPMHIDVDPGDVAVKAFFIEEA